MAARSPDNPVVTESDLRSSLTSVVSANAWVSAHGGTIWPHVASLGNVSFLDELMARFRDSEDSVLTDVVVGPINMAVDIVGNAIFVAINKGNEAMLGALISAGFSVAKGSLKVLPVYTAIELSRSENHLALLTTEASLSQSHPGMSRQEALKDLLTYAACKEQAQAFIYILKQVEPAARETAMHAAFVRYVKGQGPKEIGFFNTLKGLGYFNEARACQLVKECMQFREGDNSYNKAILEKYTIFLDEWLLEYLRVVECFYSINKMTVIDYAYSTNHLGLLLTVLEIGDDPDVEISKVTVELEGRLHRLHILPALMYLTPYDSGIFMSVIDYLSKDMRRWLMPALGTDLVVDVSFKEKPGLFVDCLKNQVVGKAPKKNTLVQFVDAYEKMTGKKLLHAAVNYSDQSQPVNLKELLAIYCYCFQVPDSATLFSIYPTLWSDAFGLSLFDLAVKNCYLPNVKADIKDFLYQHILKPMKIGGESVADSGHFISKDDAVEFVWSVFEGTLQFKDDIGNFYSVNGLRFRERSVAESKELIPNANKLEVVRLAGAVKKPDYSALLSGLFDSLIEADMTCGKHVSDEIHVAQCLLEYATYDAAFLMPIFRRALSKQKFLIAAAMLLHLKEPINLAPTDLLMAAGHFCIDFIIGYYNNNPVDYKKLSSKVLNEVHQSARKNIDEENLGRIRSTIIIALSLCDDTVANDFSNEVLARKGDVASDTLPTNYFLLYAARILKQAQSCVSEALWVETKKRCLQQLSSERCKDPFFTLSSAGFGDAKNYREIIISAIAGSASYADVFPALIKGVYHRMANNKKITSIEEVSIWSRKNPTWMITLDVINKVVLEILFLPVKETEWFSALTEAYKWQLFQLCVDDQLGMYQALLSTIKSPASAPVKGETPDVVKHVDASAPPADTSDEPDSDDEAMGAAAGGPMAIRRSDDEKGVVPPPVSAGVTGLASATGRASGEMSDDPVVVSGVVLKGVPLQEDEDAVASDESHDDLPPEAAMIQVNNTLGAALVKAAYRRMEERVTAANERAEELQKQVDEMQAFIAHFMAGGRQFLPETSSRDPMP